MKGHIEIYKTGKSGKKLIYSEDNMIVDGARQHVSDVLSFRVPVSAVSATASHALDASNFDIKAMTLSINFWSNIVPKSVPPDSTITPEIPLSYKMENKSGMLIREFCLGIFHISTWIS